jgi:hypothetical protein
MPAAGGKLPQRHVAALMRLPYYAVGAVRLPFGWETFAAEAGVRDLATFAECMASPQQLIRIGKGIDVASMAGVTGTPTVLIQGWSCSRVLSSAELKSAVRRVLDGGKPQ